MDRSVDFFSNLLENAMDTWLLVCLGVGIASLLVSFLLHRRLLAMDPGNEAMQKIGSAIRTGAMAFLKTQYTILAVFAVVGALWVKLAMRRGLFQPMAPASLDVQR